MMPIMDGYEVCEKLKSDESTKNIPIVFITAKTDEDSIERAYEVGGVDYVTKPFKPRELLARVKTQIKVKELISSLGYIASHDSMTGIYNRRKFFEIASEKFSNSKDNLYAVMIDIDKFKNINDTYGHDMGDTVIKTIAQTINNSISKDSIFGRMGGEEFAILCNKNSKDEIVYKIELLREMIEKAEVILDDENVVKYTISSGIAKVDEDTETLDSLLKRADTALYEAKGSGRNRVVFRS
jgi:diguanylate cyclase (GGDEF)-like protein